MGVVGVGMGMVMVKFCLTLFIIFLIKIICKKIEILCFDKDSDGIVFRSNGLLFTDFWKVLNF